MAIKSQRTFPSVEKNMEFNCTSIPSTLPALLEGVHQGMCHWRRIPRETNKPSLAAVASTDVKDNKVIHFQENDQEVNIWSTIWKCCVNHVSYFLQAAVADKPGEFPLYWNWWNLFTANWKEWCFLAGNSDLVMAPLNSTPRSWQISWVLWNSTLCRAPGARGSRWGKKEVWRRCPPFRDFCTMMSTE